MAETREKLATDKFVNAISDLEDITTIHTNPNLAIMRHNLMRGSSDGAVSEDMVRLLEVRGIANAVAARFRSSPWHHSNAAKAAITASMLCAYAPKYRDANAGASALGESDDGYHVFLLTQLDWVHKYGTVRDSASADVNTCLCPVTAYLQIILCKTPMEDWAVAAAATEPNASPLAFAWSWARTSPGIGRQTADVAALVTMGRCVHRLMAYELVRVEAMLATKNRGISTRFSVEGEISAALAGAVKDWFMQVTARLLDSPSALEKYKRWLNSRDAEELRAIVQHVATKLGKEGEWYAQLLGEKDVVQERESVVVTIRTLAGFIFGKAEPPVHEALVLAVDGLATAES